MPELVETLEQLLADLRWLIDEMCVQQRNEQEWASLVRELREGRTYDPVLNRTGP